LDITEQTRLPQPAIRAAEGWRRPAWTTWQQPVLDQLVRAAATVFILVAVLVITALNEHPIDISAPVGPAAQFARAMVPLGAALVATWAIYRPWPAYLAVLALTPAWDAAQMAWQVGPVQVILQTIFAVALIAGCIMRARARRSANPLWLDDPSTAQVAPLASGIAGFRLWAGRFEGRIFAQMAMVGFVALAILSTLASPNITNSATVLLHGILEPVVMGAVLVWLRPSRRELVLVAVAMGASIALGSLLNIFQTLPLYKTLSGMQAQRLYFAHTTYFNVGLFGVIVAMVVPLLLGILAARRSLRLPPLVVGLVLVLLGLTLTGLFLSFSKSAWLATSVGTAMLLLLLVKSWRRRLAMAAAVAIVSAAFIPWPALVLQVVPPVNNAYRTVAVSVAGEARFDSWNPTTYAGRGSLSERFYAVEGGVAMALDRSILGVGLNEFGIYYWRDYKPADAKNALDHAHSLFPEVGAELGLPAAILLGLAFMAALWAMWRTYRAARDQLTRTLAATFFAGLACWIIAATAFGCDIYRAVRDQSSDVIALAVIMGMALALARLARVERGSSSSREALS
jgi:O-antigen ligase